MLLSFPPPYRAGEALDALTRRSYPVLKIEPLEEAERRAFIRNYLNKISKKLTDEQVPNGVNFFLFFLFYSYFGTSSFIVVFVSEQLFSLSKV
jgi:hypothetical protein